ncbi:MAG: DUF2815 family protein, partial [Gordonibacter sp.]|uniref:DUF2815 family protein n=1 Tax=Gordonibacter sp. TaxID=1968902 RepID=UPI002FC6D158
MTQSQLDPTKVVIGPVRLGFVHLFEPYAFEAGQGAKYSCTILIPKADKKALGKIKKAQAAAIEKGIAKKWGGKKPARLGNTLRDGDADAPAAGGEEYEGHYFMNLSTKDKPHVVDGAVQPIMDATEVYSGMYANVSLNV